MSGTKPATLAQRLHAKDWDSIKERHRENILANEAMTREAMAEELAHNLMKKQQLGEKLTRWSQLVGQAAGVDPAVTLGDDEAETLLVGWATAGRFRPAGREAITTADIMHGNGSLETQLDQLIELTQAIVKWALSATDSTHITVHWEQDKRRGEASE